MIYFAWALAEIANIAVFGLLAWHFDKWWVVLFAALMGKTIKHNDRKEETK